jgi:hypothetical protein
MLPMCSLGIAFAFLIKSMHDLTFLSVLNTNIYPTDKTDMFPIRSFIFYKEKVGKVVNFESISDIFTSA